MSSNSSIDARNKLVLITVGEQQFQFSIKELCRESDYFKGMFSGSFAESKQQKIKLNEVGEEEFTIFFYWLNFRTNYIYVTSPDILARLLLLSDRFLADRLRNECLAEIKRRLSLTETFPAIFLETGLLIGNQLMEMVCDWFKTTIIGYPTNFTVDSCIESEDRILRFLQSTEFDRLKNELSEEANDYLMNLFETTFVTLIEKKVELEREEKTKTTLRKYVASGCKPKFLNSNEY